MMYAIVGYAVIIIMMILILKGKATPAFCFSILPLLIFSEYKTGDYCHHQGGCSKNPSWKL